MSRRPITALTHEGVLRRLLRAHEALSWADAGHPDDRPALVKEHREAIAEMRRRLRHVPPPEAEPTCPVCGQEMLSPGRCLECAYRAALDALTR